jgi:hypothetical protein
MPPNKPDLSNELDKAKLRNWMANAKRLNRPDVYQAALRQLCRIEGRNIDDPLESEFASVMRALEEALTQESGRTKRLNRTRQKLGRVGVRKTLADLALKPQPSLSMIRLGIEFFEGMGEREEGSGAVDGVNNEYRSPPMDLSDGLTDHAHDSGRGLTGDAICGPDMRSIITSRVNPKGGE